MAKWVEVARTRQKIKGKEHMISEGVFVSGYFG